MIKHYLNFTYNGKKSGDMGVTHVSTSSGLFQENLGANRNIIEQQNNQTDRRYFNRISLEPIEFEMNIMFNVPLTDEQLDPIFSWLLQDYYRELYFDDDVDKIYYCMVSSQPTVTHNGNGEGYITLTMRCFDGYIYSRENTYSFDLSANTLSGTTITLTNSGHVDVNPLVTIYAEQSDITILNLSTNESTQFTGLDVGETIILDNENEEISTSKLNTYRYDNHNDVYLRILAPSNKYKVTGVCTLTFKYRYKRRF